MRNRVLALLLPAVMSAGHLNAQVTFADITQEAGLTHGIQGEGLCVLDYDNDGLEDMFFASFNGRNLLYHNLGDMGFEEVAATAGIDSTGRTRLAIAADYDADGYPDLLLGCHEEPTRLFRNNGNGTFSDVTAASGIANDGDARGGTWIDHDTDGWLDAYVGNLTTPNQLCRNNGDGTFTDIAALVNARGPMPDRLVMGLAPLDYNADGRMDLFMAQDGNRGNALLRKESSGIYNDVSVEAGVVLPVQGMGVATGDYDRDGFPDVYTTNLNESSLLRNNGDGTFSDVTVQTGVGDEPGHMGWGTFFFDADNDGWLDLYNNNQTGFGQIPNSFFRNRGDGTFEDLSATSGLECWNDGIGSAFADFDNDGDLDIALSGHPSAAGNPKLFRNNTSAGHHWIQVMLVAGGANHQAIGTIARLYTADGMQTAMVSAGNGYASQNTLRLHFGLGASVVVDSLVVYWNDGTRERFDGLQGDQLHDVVQGTGVSGVDRESSGVFPGQFTLDHNYPNPFNSSTTLRFTLDRQADVRLDVITLMGERVAYLVDGHREAGAHDVVFDARGLASGVYVARLQVDRFSVARTMILLK